MYAINYFLLEKYPDDLKGLHNCDNWLENNRQKRQQEFRLNQTLDDLRAKGYTITEPVNATK